MLSTNSLGHARIFVGVALLALMQGCATRIQGSREPPLDWVADTHSPGCNALSGSYLSAGVPAPANANTSTYGAVWPVEGSLLSIVEMGSNWNPRKHPRAAPETKLEDVVPSVSIDVDASGAIRFEGKNAKGGPEKLQPQTWACENGILVTRVPLGSANADSYVRLWKHGNDLIAEQTVGVTRLGQALDAHEQRPTARFYFKFRPTID